MLTIDKENILSNFLLTIAMGNLTEMENTSLFKMGRPWRRGDSYS